MEKGRCLLSVVLFAVTTSTVLAQFGTQQKDGELSSWKEKLDSKGLCKTTGSFRDSGGCNECHCFEVGSAPACTLLACISKKKREAPGTVLAQFGTQQNDGELSSWKEKLDSKGLCKTTGSFKDSGGCNECHCFEVGSAPACTLLACISKKKREAPGTGKISPGGRCKPGDKWKLDDCNQCVCTHTGYASCSLNDCPTKKRGRRAAPSGKISPSGRCKPGDKWKLDDCNNCVCTHTGYASCTLNECPTKKRAKRGAPSGNISPGGRCKPGDKWKLDECNNCICTHTGYASCSLNECLSKKRARRTASLGNSGNECRAGHTWKDNCNSCFCSERGIAMCTDMVCPTPPPPSKN